MFDLGKMNLPIFEPGKEHKRSISYSKADRVAMAVGIVTPYSSWLPKQVENDFELAK